MESNQKLIVFSVVALVIGAALGAGIMFAVNNNNNANTDETYDFYIYFGSDNTKNGWYSASAPDAGSAFSKAMDKAGITYEIGQTGWAKGYIQSIDDIGENGWYVAQYLYKATTKAAADASILYPVVDYGVLSYSNGWKSISGYDSDDSNKLTEFCTNVFFLSPYQADYSADSPVSVNLWMTSGPFPAA